MPFVRVARAWWDSHAQNFETHQELVPELDHVMSTLLDDLRERGLLENTLVVTLADPPHVGDQPTRRSAATTSASAWSATLPWRQVLGGGGLG